MASLAATSLSPAVQLCAETGVSRTRISMALRAPKQASAISIQNSLTSSFVREASSPDFVAVCKGLMSEARGSASHALFTMGVKEAGVGILGNKVGMLTWFASGKAFPVTVIGLQQGNVVTQVKTVEKDGYTAVQIGYEAVAERKLTLPELGHLKKAFSGISTEEGSEEYLALRHLQEFRVSKIDGYEPGQQLKVEEVFKEGDLVDVSGTSIGKGFQGGIKVHNFARGLMTHGSKSHRQLGSIGAGTTPGRVYPGKKMPKRLGNQTVKIRKLEVIKIDTELNAIIVKGSVPGKPGNLLRVTPAKIVGKNI